VIGCLFTNVIMRLDAAPASAAAVRLREVRGRFLRARQEQALPFEMFADELGLAATRQRRPPYCVYLSYRNAFLQSDFGLPDTHVVEVPVATGRNTQKDIVLNVTECRQGDGLDLEVEWLWRRDRFQPAAIERSRRRLEERMAGYTTGC